MKITLIFILLSQKLRKLLNAFSTWEFSKKTTANNNSNLTESEEAHLVL